MASVPRQRHPDAPPVVYRSARIELRTTPAQRRRCLALLRSGGDLWATVLEFNEYRRRRDAPEVANYQALCRELSAAGPGCFGELSSTGARSILRRYSDAWMSASKRRKAGDLTAHSPRRKKALVPSRYYAGTFSLEGKRLSLPTARGDAPLGLRLTRAVPYDAASVRSVTLLAEGRRLYVEVCAEVPVQVYPEGAAPDPGHVAGVDLGIIHPYVLANPDGALVVSGRAMRAESRLHLAESKGRKRAVARRVPRRGQRGSRRWRKYRTRTKVLEARHRRRLDQARFEAAREVVAYAQKHRIGTLVVGDPRGLLGRDSGRRQNLAVRNWRVGRLISALSDKAEVAGIAVVLVDERGTSSTCPCCGARVPKPKGRGFTCQNCALWAHRDVVGAANIASRSPRGGIVIDPSGLVITHRRAGRHLPGRARRDPRRVAMSRRGRSVGPWPAVARPADVRGGDRRGVARQRGNHPLARNRHLSPRAGEGEWSQH